MKTIAPNLNGQGLKIGIVQARFTNEVGSAMVEAARKKLLELGVADDDITLATVPGALIVRGKDGELPQLLPYAGVWVGEHLARVIIR